MRAVSPPDTRRAELLEGLVGMSMSHAELETASRELLRMEKTMELVVQQGDVFALEHKAAALLRTIMAAERDTCALGLHQLAAEGAQPTRRRCWRAS